MDQVRKGQWVKHPTKGVGIAVQATVVRVMDGEVVKQQVAGALVHWVDAQGETKRYFHKERGRAVDDAEAVPLIELAPAALSEIPARRRPEPAK